MGGSFRPATRRGGGTRLDEPKQSGEKRGKQGAAFHRVTGEGRSRFYNSGAIPSRRLRFVRAEAPGPFATMVHVRFALLLWLALLTAMSLAPTSLKWRMGTMGPLHTWDHFLAFFVAGALLCWNAGSFSSLLLRCLAGVAIAAVLEGMEAAVYHNPFEWRDLRTDWLGVVLGAAATIGAPRVLSAIAKRRLL